MVRALNYNMVFDGQRHFRVLLNSMARPGEIHKLNDVDLQPPEGLNTATALIGFALLNSDVSFFLEKSQPKAIEYLEYNTGSKLEIPQAADFVFLHANLAAPDKVKALKAGDSEYPESGATLILLIHSIWDRPVPNALSVSLSGPGVKDTKNIYLEGISRIWLEQIQLKNEDYPLGIDTILVDQNNQLTCIPRSNRITIL